MGYYTRWIVERFDAQTRTWKRVCERSEKIGTRTIDAVRTVSYDNLRCFGIQDSSSPDIRDSDQRFVDGPWLLTRHEALLLAALHREIVPGQTDAPGTFTNDDLLTDINNMALGDRLIIWGDP